MADTTLFLGDAGLGAGAVGGVKGRSEAGGKGHADVANDQGEDFEQILAKGNKSRDGDAEANADKDPAVSKSRVRGPSVRWPESSEGVGKDGKSVDEIERDKGKSKDTLLESELSSEDVPEADRSVTQRPTPEVSSNLLAGTPAWASAGHADPGMGVGKTAQDQGVEVGNKKPMPSGHAGKAADELLGAKQARETPPTDASGQTTRAAQESATVANQMSSRNPAGPILPGMVQPAVAQLTSVLSQSRETSKRDITAQRGTPDIPAKLNVSLAETHFSPVKPDSELEAYDLARRIEGDGSKGDSGKSARDMPRTQDMRSERAARNSTLTQTDVRAEQLAQNVARPASGDISGQIGTRILQELEQARPLSETRNSGPVQVKQSDPVLKVLEIKLEPRDLGSVVVRMSLRNDVLNVELGFGRSEAAATIAKNTDQLTHYLRSSGYVVDEVVVRVVDTDHRVHSPITTTATTGADSTQAQGAVGNSATSSGLTGQSFGEQGERRPSAGGQNSASQHRGEGAHDQDNSQSRAHGGLFV